MTYKEIILDANNIYDAFRKSIAGSIWKESSQRVYISLLDYTFKLQKELASGKYKPGEETNFILRERGKVRAISSLNVKDRAVRHLLCDYIFMPLIQDKIIYDNGASISGKGISFTRSRFETHLHRYFMHNGNKGYILFGDYSKFYDNVLHTHAKKLLYDLVDDDKFVCDLLNTIFETFKIDVSYMSYDEYIDAYFGVFDKLSMQNNYDKDGIKYLSKSINIGDQLSQLIGIYYPNEIDAFIKIVKHQKYYGRYMDDWYILNPSKDSLNELLYDISNKSKTIGLTINKKKTNIVRLDKPFSFLQIRYELTDTGKIIKRINPKRIIDMKRRLKKLSIKVCNNEIDYINVENMFRSWMGSFYKLLSKRQRIELILLFEKLFNTHVKICNNKMIIEYISQ